MKIKPILYVGTPLAVFIVANAICWPPKEPAIRRNIDPPEYSQRRVFEKFIRMHKPRVILLGNSILGEAVDELAFCYGIKRQSAKLKFGGGASAWWYLVFKNVIVTAPQKPRVVAICFRDHFLTYPSYRTTGDYFKRYIDEMAGESEPVLDRLAYYGDMNGVTWILARYCPLYQQHETLKPRIQSSVKQLVFSFIPSPAGSTADQAIENIFDEKNMNRHLLTVRQLAAESVDNMKLYDFDRQIDKSLLPHIIRMAKDNNIHLIFVRMKRRRDILPHSQPKMLVQYIDKLKLYLDQQDCDFIDFTDDPRIRLDHFGDGDHFNAGGKEVFTPILIETMLPLIDKYDHGEQ